MRTHRSLLTLAFVAVVSIGAGACVAFDEAVNDRDVTCVATPDGLCVRVAEVGVGGLTALLEEHRSDEIVVTAVTVAPADCADIGRAGTATRCWRVDATFLDGYADIPITSSIAPGSIGTWVYERPDGSLDAEP